MSTPTRGNSDEPGTTEYSAVACDPPLLWRGRVAWQVRLRWMVPPAIMLGVLAGRRLGIEIETVPVLAIAAGIAAYNIVLAVAASSLDLDVSPRGERRYNALQASLDYAATLALVHYTGGPASPLVFLFVPHVVLAAVLFPQRMAWGFTAAATLAMGMLSAAELGGLLPHHPIGFRNEPAELLVQPGHVALRLLLLGGTVLATAALATFVMERLRRENARASEAARDLMLERSASMVGLAHGLRTPLTAALSMLDLIAQEYLGPVTDAQRDYLERTRKRLWSLHDMVGALLFLAHDRERAQPSTLDPVDLSAVVERVRRSFAGEAELKGVRLEALASDDLPRVAGEAAQLERMLENLVSNAVKYTPPGGLVSIAATRLHDGRLRLEVRDTGIGVPEDELPKLFSRFFRASNARRAEVAGTGLGLVIVKQVAERHGGRIEVQSKEWQGSTFAVELPAA